MREQLAELLESEAGLMYKMVTMVPPGEAVRAGVRVCGSVARERRESV